MLRPRLVSLTCLFHLVHGASAWACGSTPEMLSALLPQADAPDVPLNGALIAASNNGPVAFSLRRVDGAEAQDSVNAATADEDAGPTVDATVDAAMNATVDLVTTCFSANGGQLCVAQPATLLSPGATYEWFSSRVGPDGVASSYPPPTELRRFRTSDTAHTPETSDVNIEVVTYETYTSHPCGQTSFASLGLTAMGLSTPVVVNVKGFTPSYVMEPVVLSAATPSADFSLYSPPACMTLELFDAAGARTDLGQLCIDAAIPTPTAASGDPATSSAPATSATSSEAGPEPTTNPGTPAPSETASSADGGSNPEPADVISRHALTESAGSAGCQFTHARGELGGAWASLFFAAVRIWAARSGRRREGARRCASERAG